MSQRSTAVAPGQDCWLPGSWMPLRHGLQTPISDRCILGRQTRMAIRRRAKQLRLSSRMQIDLESPSENSGMSDGVSSMALAVQDDRFLLVGQAGGSVSLFDLEGQYSLERTQQQQQQQRQALSRNRSGSSQSTASTRVVSNRQHTTRAMIGTGTEAKRHVTSMGRHRRATQRESRRAVGMAGHRGTVHSIDWYPVDQGMFSTAGADGNVLIWDTASMMPVNVYKMRRRMYCASWSPTGQHCLLATGGNDPKVILCDPATGAASHTLVGHTSRVMATAWSPSNPNLLVSGSSDGSIRVWDVRRSGSAACISSLDMHQQSSRARKLGAYATIAGGSTRQHHRNKRRAIGAGVRSTSRSARRNPTGDDDSDDDNSISAGQNSLEHDDESREGGVVAEEEEQQEEQQRGRVRGPHGSASTSLVKAHAAAVTGLVFDESGRNLISTGADDRARLWTETRQTHTGRGEHAIEDFCNTFINYAGTINRRTSRPSRPVLAPSDRPADSLLFHPQNDPGQFTVAVYNVQSGALVDTLRGHFAPVTSCAYRISTQELFTGCEDGMVVAWEPNTGPGTAAKDDLSIENSNSIGGAGQLSRRNGNSGGGRIRDSFEDEEEDWDESD